VDESFSKSLKTQALTKIRRKSDTEAEERGVQPIGWLPTL
jgi:hypothetical protein